MLVWAVLMAPQLSLVHALSHIASQSTEERQQAPDKVCDSCLAFAQVGTALPSHHEWRAHAAALPEPTAHAPHATVLRTVTYFLARAPPPALS